MNTSRNFYFPMMILMVLLLIIQFMDLNQLLFLKLNHTAQFIPISWWGYITNLGDGMIAGCILAMVFRRNPRIALIGIMAVLISGIIVQILKSYFYIPRPAGILNLDEFYLFGDVLKSRGFPSGHSSTVFALLGTFYYIHEHKINFWIYFSASIIIAFSRVAIGIHWPEDIIAGAMIGMAVIYLLSIKLRTYKPGLKVEISIGIFLLLICIGTLFYDPHMPGMHMIQWLLGLTGTGCIISRFYYSHKSYGNNI